MGRDARHRRGDVTHRRATVKQCEVLFSRGNVRWSIVRALLGSEASGIGRAMRGTVLVKEGRRQAR
jgi:hypothetical protein